MGVLSAKKIRRGVGRENCCPGYNANLAALQCAARGAAMRRNIQNHFVMERAAIAQVSTH
jgi:hypothetical protein